MVLRASTAGPVAAAANVVAPQSPRVGSCTTKQRVTVSKGTAANT